jgi:hypothetical protein
MAHNFKQIHIFYKIFLFVQNIHQKFNRLLQLFHILRNYMRRKIIVMICILLMIPGSGVFAVSSHNTPKDQTMPLDDGTEYWALLVGCNIFMNRPDLELPGNDLSAEHLRDILLLSDHWQPDHIKLLTGKNASSLNILRGLRWLDKMDDEDDICLFYIASHAGPLAADFPPYDEPNGDECLTTYTSHRFYNQEHRVSFVCPWISYLYDDEINLFLNHLDAQGICAIFNTCYAGGFNDSFTERVVGRRIGQGIEATISPVPATQWMNEFATELSGSRRVVLMACEEDQLSLGPVFSYYVSEGLLGVDNAMEDEMVSAEDAFMYAAQRTKSYMVKEFEFPQNPQIYDEYPGELQLTDPEQPPNHPTFNGPTIGMSGITHTYSMSSDDPEGDTIRYYIDWGDGTEEWTPYHQSGDQVEFSHVFDSEGVYNIWFDDEDKHGVSLYEPTFIDRMVTIISDEDPIDQKQIETYQYQCFNDGPLSKEVWLAQSFTPALNVLSKVSLETIISTVNSKEIGPLHVSIRDNLTGADLTEVFTMPWQLDSNILPFVKKFKWTTFDFPDISVIPGRTYYIVCRFDSDSVGAWTYAGVDYVNDPQYHGDPYPNGKNFYSTNGGMTWHSNNRIHDFCFVTYGN